MNRTDLIAAMAEKSGLSKADAEKALKAYVETVKETLSKGESVQLIGFGSFEVVNRPERSVRNPRTGETTISPACRVPKFKVGKALKEAVK